MDEAFNEACEMLPGLSTTQKQLLKSKFEEMGVSNMETMQYLKVEDLTDIIKLIPARRFLLGIKRKIEKNDDENSSASTCESTYNTDHSTSTILLNSPSSSTPDRSLSDDTASPQASHSMWSQSFKIPWEKFPKSFLDQCENGKRPEEYLRRETIRILVDSIREECPKPSSRELHVISAKFVNRYQDSLGDIILGRVIGNGYASVLSNLTERVNNLNRKSNNDSTETINTSANPKTYGCLQTWSIDIDPEAEKQMIAKKEWMIQEFATSKNFTCKSTIADYMSDTYPLQRKLINSCPTSEVKKEFPYLFNVDVMSNHFKTLTGHSLYNYKNNEKRKFSLIHHLRKEKSTSLQKELAIMDAHCKEINPHIKLMAFIKLLLLYFKEEGLLEFHQPCTDVNQVESFKRNNGAPIVAVIGDLYSPVFHHVVLENNIVSTSESIDEAVMILFGIYYVFNLEYHPQATQTLEFIQRALIGINPDSGTKKPKRSIKKGGVSSRVITLASHIDDQ